MYQVSRTPLSHHPSTRVRGVRSAFAEMPDGRLLDKEEVMKRPQPRRLLTVSGSPLTHHGDGRQHGVDCNTLALDKDGYIGRVRS